MAVGKYFRRRARHSGEDASLLAPVLSPSRRRTSDESLRALCARMGIDVYPQTPGQIRGSFPAEFDREF